MEKRINYYTGDFQSLFNQLIDYAKRFYPETYTDFDEGAVGTLFFELSAAIGDNLRFNIERAVQETQIEYAQERTSLFAMARTFGLKVPNKRPAITVVEYSVDVPPLGSSFDLSYCPLILRGGGVIGNGQIFENKYDIDFKNPMSINGLPNRTITPNIDNSGRIASYTITKQEVVVAGKTKYFNFPITQDIVTPYMKITMPDIDIISIEGITELDGVNYNRLPLIGEQLDPNKKWVVVDSLAQQHVFTGNPLLPSDSYGTIVGKWEYVTKKFMYEFTDNGYCELVFGSGLDRNSIPNTNITTPYALLQNFNNFSNNISLGELPRPGTTMFVKYRVGGGQRANVAANVIRSTTDLNLVIGGADQTVNNRVRQSLRVNNPIPAFGGADMPTVEELRYMIKYNFQSQERCVTLKDYLARLMLMEGKFGTPARVSVANRDNKIEISILGFDTNGKLTNQSTNTLKANIAEYLSNYRQINDYVVVQDGRVINIQFQYKIIIRSDFTPNEILTAVANVTNSYVNRLNVQMGQDLFVSNLTQLISQIGGVISVSEIKVFNKIGGDYSLNPISQTLVDNNTREINLGVENAVKVNNNEILEIKNLNTDIRVSIAQI